MNTGMPIDACADPGNRPPELSVVIAVGDRRERVARMLAALEAQSARERLEVILADAASPSAPSLPPFAGAGVRSVRAEPGCLPGRARSVGAAAARGRWVAFLEDHCEPEAGWAAAVLAAHRQGWTAVGYAFVNGSPDTYLFRSIFLAEYGPWSHPHPGGAVIRLPGSNVSYERAALAAMGPALGDLMEADYTLHERLRSVGGTFCVAAGAVVRHASHSAFLDVLRVHLLFSRVQAERRARTFAWSSARRFGVAMAAPAALPALQLARGWVAIRRRGLAAAWRAAVPVAFLIHQAEAVGESLGLLFGAGNSRRRFACLELNGERRVCHEGA